MHVCVTYIEYYGWGGTLLGFKDYIDPESEKKKGVYARCPHAYKTNPGGQIGLGAGAQPDIFG